MLDVLTNKLSSPVEVSPEEIANSEVPDKFTILIILDQIYALFRRQPLTGISSPFKNIRIRIQRTQRNYLFNFKMLIQI